MKKLPEILLAALLLWGFGCREAPAENRYPGTQPYVAPTAPPPSR